MEHTLLCVLLSLPVASVSVSPQGLLYSGETVTLQCDISDYTDWTYRWFRDNQELPIQNRKNSISLPDQAGQYKCVGRRRGRPQKSYLSSALPIIITALPTASVKIVTPQGLLYSGETVTLQCDISDYTDWTYSWFRDNQELPIQTIKTPSLSLTRKVSTSVVGGGEVGPRIHMAAQLSPSSSRTQTRLYTSNLQPSGYSYTLSRVSVSDGGQYWCRAGRGDPVYYTLETCCCSDPPPNWTQISEERLCTMRCDIQGGDTDWRIYQKQAMGTTEDSYTLIPAGPTHTGEYVCRAGRGDPVYDTLYSEPQFLWSGDLQPSVSLRISPNATQHFTSKSLSLSCEEKGNSTGWRLMSYRERGMKSGCVSNWGSITGSTCTISYTYTGDSGVFWCESGSGEYSNAVNITVNDGDVILESPVHPVTEGDFVTLSCKYRTVSSNFKADFYKDGVRLIKNETTGEMTIPTVSKSDEGFYKCKSGQGESPGSWVTVRVVAPGSSTSVLVGVVVGLVVAGVLLVILLVLLWRYQNSKGSCFIRIFWPPQPQSTNQDPQQDQGSTQGQAPDTGYTHQQHGGTNIYDTINPSDNNDNDAAGASAAGPSHVTYAQIQLNKLDKKKKAAAGPVDVTYAEVDLQKKVKAKKKRAAAGPVDVTYAEVDLQKKVKAKKKRATPPVADSVYSQVKQHKATEPMQVGRISQAERDRRMRERCCLYCGKPAISAPRVPGLQGNALSRAGLGGL
ncbi:hypothetical protein J4Q44_G00377020 [Coregonus suidteri]|uniref:Ig-like domain-containing protein n=1 Tax=Coregonus suidteri TaxID=861788 RepID=A0AAN8KGC9_9TELE